MKRALFVYNVDMKSSNEFLQYELRFTLGNRSVEIIQSECEHNTGNTLAATTFWKRHGI